jgi:hypothetical protein
VLFNGATVAGENAQSAQTKRALKDPSKAHDSKIVSLSDRRLCASEPPFGSEGVENACVVKIGRGPLSADAPTQIDDFIEFLHPLPAGIFEKARELYKNGSSLNQISRELRYSKDKIRGTLIEGGVVLRPSNRDLSAVGSMDRQLVSRGTAPYGFEFHNGGLVRNAKEVSVVHRIMDLRSKGLNVTDIARMLNGLKLKTRNGTKWDHSLVGRIARRCEKNESPYQEIFT